MKLLCSKTIEGQRVDFFVDDQGVIIPKIGDQFANMRGLPRQPIKTEQEQLQMKEWLEQDIFLSKTGPFIEINPRMKGGWGEEVHSGIGNKGGIRGTYQWVQDILPRNSREFAEIIARACNGVDARNLYTSPLTESSRHFNTTREPDGRPIESGSWSEETIEGCDSRLIHAKREFSKARRHWRIGSHIPSYHQLGVGLHSIQDMFAHDDGYVGSDALLHAHSGFLGLELMIPALREGALVGSGADNPRHIKPYYFRGIDTEDGPAITIADSGQILANPSVSARYYDTQAATYIYLTLFEITVCEDESNRRKFIDQLNKLLGTVHVTRPRICGFLAAFSSIMTGNHLYTFSWKWFEIPSNRHESILQCDGYGIERAPFQTAHSPEEESDLAVDRRDADGYTRLLRTIEDNQPENREQVLEYVRAGANPWLCKNHSGESEGYNALHLATYHNREDLVRIICSTEHPIRQALDTKIRRPGLDQGHYPGCTPLLIALDREYFDIAMTLIEAGADPSLSRKTWYFDRWCHGGDWYGYNALHIAVYHGNVGLVQAICQSHHPHLQAALNARVIRPDGHPGESRGKTPYEIATDAQNILPSNDRNIARILNYSKIVKILEEAAEAMCSPQTRSTRRGASCSSHARSLPNIGFFPGDTGMEQDRLDAPSTSAPRPE